MPEQMTWGLPRPCSDKSRRVQRNHSAVEGTLQAFRESRERLSLEERFRVKRRAAEGQL